MNRKINQILLVLSLSAIAGQAIAQAPANDECTGAIPLPVSSTSACTNATAGNNINATPSTVIGDCALNPTTANDVWYSFVATATDHVVRLSNVSTTNSAADFYSYSMAVFSGDCGTLTQINCYSGNSGFINNGVTLELTGLTIGDTYFIQFFGDGAYDVNVNPVAADYNFNICITPVAPASLNDECAGAIDISNGQLVSATNQGATQSIAPGSCGFSTIANDVWFKITATANGDITVNQYNPSANLVLEQLTGDCTAPVPGACAGGGGFGGDNTLTFPATAGTTYYLRTYGTFETSEGISALEASGTGIPLPVDMDRLSGKSLAPGKVQLSWNTYQEQGNAGFEIQRSVDGKQFHEIGFVASMAEKGNSRNRLAYQYTDVNASPTTAWYRLKQVDRDGQTTFSTILQLAGYAGASIGLTATPNPVKDQLRISTRVAGATNAVILITDLSGKVQQKIEVTREQTDIDLGSYAKGIYLLRYSSKEYTQTLKINKQ